MTNIARAPFYVPRPSDDAYWSGTPVDAPILPFLTKQKMFGAGGQVPTKRWSPVYTYDDPASYQQFIWVNHTAQLVLTEVKFFGRNGQAPTKNWNGIYTQDDAAVWLWPPQNSRPIIVTNTQLKQFGRPGQVPTKQWNWIYTNDDAPTWAFAYDYNQPILIPALSANVVLQAPFYIPRPPDDNIWLLTVDYNQPIRVSAAAPFKVTWKIGYDDPPSWQGDPNTYNSAEIQLLTGQKMFGAGGQVPAKQWRYDTDDAAVWSFSFATIIRNTTVQASNNILRSPFFVPRPGDLPDWQWVPPNPFTSSVVQYQTGNQYLYYNVADDPPSWQWKLPYNVTANFVKLAPFKAVFAKFNDDAAVWNAAPIPTGAVNLTQTQLKQFGQHGQVTAKQWHYDNDDSAVWWNWINKNAVKDTIVPKPLTLPAQQFVLSSDEPWALTQQRNTNTLSIVLSPFKLRQPRFDADDQSVWWNWINKNIAGLTVAPSPVIARQPRFDSNDASTWQWQFIKPIAPTAFTVRANFSFADYHYDDAGVWQFKFNRPFAPAPFIVTARFAFSNYDDAPTWSAVLKPSSLTLTVRHIAPIKPNFGLPEESFWSPIFQAVVNKFLPPPRTAPFVSGKWAMDLPQDTPPIMPSRGAALLIFFLKFFASPRFVTALTENRVVSPSELRTATAPPENRVVIAPPKT